MKLAVDIFKLFKQTNLFRGDLSDVINDFIQYK